MKPEMVKIYRYTGIFILLTTLIWCSDFFLSGHFGLYEDDYTRIPAAMGWTWQEFFQQTWTIIATFSGQGRPLQPVLVDFFSRLAGSLGSFHSLYMFGFFNLTIVAFLFYTVMDRVLPKNMAILSAIIFVLFPADTTQPFLYHSLGLYPALIFFFLACHLYLSRKYGLAYTALIFALLTYETIVPVFVALPLFTFRWTKQWRRKFVLNASVVALLLLSAYGLRMMTGEKRVAEMGIKALLTTPFVHMIQGPVVSLGTFVYRPIQVLQNLSIDLFTVVIFAFLVIYGVMRLLQFEQDVADPSQLIFSPGMIRKRSLSPFLKQQLLNLAAGATMLISSYALTYTVRAYALTGRDTRVHLSAVVGASIIVGVIASLFLYYVQQSGWRNIGNIILSGYFALLVGFGVLVQNDYRRSWENQRVFWSDLIELAPDLVSGTMILVEPEGFLDTRQIAANTWNLPRILNQIFQFPPEWDVPRVYRLVEGWQDRILTEDGKFMLDAATTIAPPSQYRTVEPEDVIILNYIDGVMVRRPPLIEIQEREIFLKQRGDDVLAVFPRMLLYDQLIDELGD